MIHRATGASIVCGAGCTGAHGVVLGEGLNYGVGYGVQRWRCVPRHQDSSVGGDLLRLLSVLHA